MNREWLIVSLLLLITVFISGCSVLDESQGNYTPEYKDEALKFDYEITGQVLPSQIINMKVRLTNQVQDDVENVELRVTDFYGLKLVSQLCSGGILLQNTPDDKSVCGSVSDRCGCKFSSIPSLDEKEITLVFKVPSSNEIATIGRELKPEFTLKYKYHGETNYFIPILKADEKSTSAKIELVQTKGPIHVEIERGFTSSSKDWEISGSQFSVVSRVKDVVNPKSEIEIYNENFLIDFNEPYLKLSPQRELCDFDTPSTRVVGYYIPDFNITLPLRTPLVCALEVSNTEVPWVYGTITVNYNYNYKMVKTETIDVETEIA